MAENSGIAWTTHTHNPWWGCAKVSEACKHCYAETLHDRFGGGLWGVNAERRVTSEANWKKPVKWNRDAAKAGRRDRVFCASMADVFEGREDLVAPRARLFSLIESTPHLDWLLLTKRPENMLRLSPLPWRAKWPSNVWAGTTAESQRRLDERVPHLLAVPAAIRFLSVEPQMEAVDVSGVVGAGKVSWVITGGESGFGARAYDAEWARSIVRQCQAAGATPFVKQLGRVAYDGPKRLTLRDRAGADPAEWPEDLRVQEFPRSMS